MKKTYIKPETTVVALNVRDNVLQALSAPEEVTLTTTNTIDSGDDIAAREVIRSRGAWEEW